MSSHENDEQRKTRRQKDAGPQGTQVFSREEVGQLLQDAGDKDAHSGGAELRGVSASVNGQTFPISGSTMVVGRAPGCTIHLDESSVSSEHARLVRDDGAWRVINLLSTNGTFVNDKKISNAVINDGDRVRFGGAEFVFNDPDGGRRERSSHASGWRRWLPWVGGAAVIVAIVFAVAELL